MFYSQNNILYVFILPLLADCKLGKFCFYKNGCHQMLLVTKVGKFFDLVGKCRECCLKLIIFMLRFYVLNFYLYESIYYIKKNWPTGVDSWQFSLPANYDLEAKWYNWQCNLYSLSSKNKRSSTSYIVSWKFLYLHRRVEIQSWKFYILSWNFFYQTCFLKSFYCFLIPLEKFIFILKSKIIKKPNGVGREATSRAFKKFLTCKGCLIFELK